MINSVKFLKMRFRRLKAGRKEMENLMKNI